MTRNLRAILLTVLIASAFGMLATTAQAEEFTAPGATSLATTTLKPSKDTGIAGAKTSHHVFEIGNEKGTSTVSITCEEITGPAHIIGPTNTEATLTPSYSGCSAAGQAVTVTNTGCLFRFTVPGGLITVADDELKLCAHGNKPIDIAFSGCKIEVGAQPLSGIRYHNLTAGGTTVGSNEGVKVTVEPVVLGITYNATGANCFYGTTNNGIYTTGNTIVSGEREGNAVTVRWDVFP